MSMQRAGILSVVALLAVTSAARAQQLISVAPGIVLVMPAAPPVPNPVAMIEQMNTQMAQMKAMMQAQLQQAGAMQATNGAYSTVVVTSFSDGKHSCTEQITYPSAGAAQKVQVSETGNACASLGMVPGAQPASVPLHPVPVPVTPPARQNSPPLVIADNNGSAPLQP